MNLIQQLEAEQIAASGKNIPEFRPGDTLRVGVKVVEGERTRIQNFEGVCIARSNKGMGSCFTVRKISFGEGVERVFPLYSPNVASIEVVRRSDRPFSWLLPTSVIARHEAARRSSAATGLLRSARNDDLRYILTRCHEKIYLNTS